MASKDGSTILNGVDWWWDSKTVTVIMFPASCNKGVPYVLQPAKTWANKCGYCKKEGTLYAHGRKGLKTATEGEITFKSCDTDYDGISGKSKGGDCRYSLIPASSTTSSTAQSAEKSVIDRKEALYNLKQDYQTRKLVKAKKSLTTLIIPAVDCGKYVKLKAPLDDDKTFYVSSLHLNPDTMTIELHDGYPEPSSKYTDKVTIKKK